MFSTNSYTRRRQQVATLVAALTGVLVAVLLVIIGTLVGAWFCLPKPPLMDDISFSRRVFDRDGHQLRVTLRTNISVPAVSGRSGRMSFMVMLWLSSTFVRSISYFCFPSFVLPLRAATPGRIVLRFEPRMFTL